MFGRNWVSLKQFEGLLVNTEPNLKLEVCFKVNISFSMFLFLGHEMLSSLFNFFLADSFECVCHINLSFMNYTIFYIFFHNIEYFLSLLMIWWTGRSLIFVFVSFHLTLYYHSMSLPSMRDLKVIHSASYSNNGYFFPALYCSHVPTHRVTMQV